MPASAGVLDMQIGWRHVNDIIDIWILLAPDMMAGWQVTMRGLVFIVWHANIFFFFFLSFFLFFFLCNAAILALICIFQPRLPPPPLLKKKTNLTPTHPGERIIWI